MKLAKPTSDKTIKRRPSILAAGPPKLVQALQKHRLAGDPLASQAWPSGACNPPS